MDGPPVQEGIQQLEELIHAIDDLRRRVAALEQRSAILGPNSELPRPAIERTVLPEVSSGLLAAMGRFLLGVAGAYLLRAITEAGVLPQLTGTLVGLLYAGGWLVASVRTAASNRILLAVEGLTASAIAAPLLWEATARFHVMRPGGAAMAVAFFIILGQLVAWRHDHNAIAAITALAGAGTAVALIAATLDPVPFTIALVFAAAVVEYGAIRDYALAWRWIIALAADFCAFLLVYLVTRPHGLPEGYAAVPLGAVGEIQFALVAIYLTSTISRTLVRRLPIAWFEIAQLTAVIGFAIVSNLRFSGAMAIAMIAAGSACYVAAFAGAARRLDRNFHAYATLAVIFLIGGGFLLLEGIKVVALWSVLGLLATWFGSRRSSCTLRVQGAIYLVAAAAVSATLGSYWLLTAAAALAYGITLRAASEKRQTVMERIPSALVAALLSWGLFGITTAALSGTRVEASSASMLRTVLISLIAIALGWFGKRWNLIELIWVLYPWMAFGAVKLFVDDFAQGRPATLAASLLVYGGTLIALPRLLRRPASVRTDLS